MSNLRHSPHNDNPVSGFSLVELSIVLVILGLLTGGILAGQSLIRAAELRSITQDINNFSIMASSFVDRYQYLPGDMPNAERFWGSSNECSGADTNGVCNGDGDGRIRSDRIETWQFWRHAAKSGLLAGSYTGVGYNGTLHLSKAGVNAPESHFGLWLVRSPHSWGAYQFVDSSDFYEVALVLSPGSDAYWMEGDALIPEEAWNIDNKIDDGKPATGNFISEHWEDCTLATNQNDVDADYDLSNSDRVCAAKVINIFH